MSLSGRKLISIKNTGRIPVLGIQPRVFSPPRCSLARSSAQSRPPLVGVAIPPARSSYRKVTVVNVDTSFVA
jgi:hypothetical protein